MQEIFPLDVERSERFRATVAWLQERVSKKPHGAHATMLNAIEHHITNCVAVSNICFGSQTYLRGDLAGVLRVKVGKRGRLFFIASANKKKAWILHFSDHRKDGDKNDAYAEFSRLLRTSEFDPLFADLELTKPSL
jgi:hypothetical protein